MEKIAPEMCSLAFCQAGSEHIYDERKNCNQCKAISFFWFQFHKLWLSHSVHLLGGFVRLFFTPFSSA